MPSAIKQDQELRSKGLVSILVEVQRADDKKLAGFLMHKFPDNECMASTACVVPIPESRGIPHGGLVSVDGTLLWSGNPISDKAKVEELIAAELKRVKKGWGKTPEAKKVRAALYGRGNLAKAASLVATMDDSEEKTKLQAEVTTRYAASKAAVLNLQKQGDWLKARDATKQLSKAVGRHAEWLKEVGELAATFETPDATAELAADKKLQKIVKNLRKEKFEKVFKDLTKFVAKYGQTTVGKRAASMLAAVSA